MHRLVALIGVLAMSCTAGSTSTAGRPSDQAAAPPTPVVVFWSFESSRQSTLVHYTIALPDGSVVQKLDLDGTGYAAYQDESAALLLFRTSPELSISYVNTSGVVNQVPASLTAAFDWTKGGIGGNNLDGTPIFPDNQTLVGVYGDGTQTTKYVLLDLKGGKEYFLLSASSSSHISSLLPAGLSADGKTGWVIVRHANIGSTSVATWAVAEIDLSQRRMTSLKRLPLKSGVDSSDIFSPTISPNGRFLAYQENPNPDSPYSEAVFTTHILDRVSGRDVIAGGAPYVLPGYPKLLRFSPDGALLFVFGESPLATGVRDRVIGIYDTSGRSVWSRDVGDSFYNAITPVGWIDGHDFVYSTISTTRRGDFNGSATHSYVADVTTGSERELPADLGTAIAVLR